MENTDPYAHETAERPAEEATRLNISPIQSTHLEAQDTPWLRMDPSLARAVLAKTEEDLLGGLAALMRNKVEHEQVSRRLAQIQIDTAEAKREFEAVQQQIRRAEEEVATRINEQMRLSEEITNVRQELAALREEHRHHLEAVSGLKNDAAQANQLLVEIQQRLGSAKAEAVAAESAELSQVKTEESLPLWFGSDIHPISRDWDSYPLESEFHTDEELDANKIAELVAQLPGLEGCLIVKNHGQVLAAKLPVRIHAHLQAPNRNYHLLFERLGKKVREYNLPKARLATFDLGDEGLTVAQASHAFIFVNHKQTKLRPGVPDKLASIAAEVAKMYG